MWHSTADGDTCSTANPRYLRGTPYPDATDSLILCHNCVHSVCLKFGLRLGLSLNGRMIVFDIRLFDQLYPNLTNGNSATVLLAELPFSRSDSNANGTWGISRYFLPSPFPAPLPPPPLKVEKTKSNTWINIMVSSCTLIKIVYNTLRTKSVFE